VLEEVAWQLMLHYHCQWRSPLSPAEASAKSSSRIILAPHRRDPSPEAPSCPHPIRRSYRTRPTCRCDELSVEQGLLAWTRALLANSQELPCVSDLTAETFAPKTLPFPLSSVSHHGSQQVEGRQADVCACTPALRRRQPD